MKRTAAIKTPADLPSAPEAAAESQAAWLAAIVSSSHDAIIGKNLRGIVTSWNRGAERLFGYGAGEAIGRSILFLIPPTHRQEEDLILSKVAAGEHVDHYETVRVRKDGSLVHVSLTVSPVKAADGSIVGASKIARDISERKRSEALLREAQAALLESERQVLAVSDAERQRIGADLHDNLGQQLTAIELLCHSLAQDLVAQPGLESRMEEVCRYLREAVAQTRQLARGLMPVALNGGGLADGLAEMALRMTHGATRCDFIYPSPVEISDSGIAIHLYHIAQEAVNNAVKHARARRILLTLARKGETVLLRVADDGEGFPKSIKGESGVGLRIMRDRANVIGAKLETKSIPGKGVTVTCTLESSR